MMNQNLFDVFTQRFPADRSRSFIIYPEGGALSYAEMTRHSGRLANYFNQLGLGKGDRVAVQVHKSPMALMVYLACLRAGLVYLPLNTGYQHAELEYFFSDASPALIVADPQQTDFLRQSPTVAGARFETLDKHGQGSLVSASAALPEAFVSVPCGADDLAAILYTSGTTGRPKGAMLSHGNLSSNALMLCEYWGWSDRDVLLHALPIFHVHGLFVACHCVLAAGAAMIFLPGFSAPEVLAQLPRATVMMGVPTFYTRLLAEPDWNRSSCDAVRLFISGSAPLLASTHQQFEQRTGAKILERYGMTETGMLTSNPLQGERRAGTVGQALPGVQVRIVDQELRPVAEPEVGAIQVKGPNIFQGYWQMPEKTAEEFTADGYFITGDQGVMSADGYIAIVGRAKDMVISGGYNVYPKEVELVIDKIAGVKESAVFGLADADFGEAVTAAVVLDGSQTITAETIIDQARQQLAAYKVPKTVYLLDELPRNTMGKVQKAALRERYNS